MSRGGTRLCGLEPLGFCGFGNLEGEGVGVVADFRVQMSVEKHKHHQHHRHRIPHPLRSNCQRTPKLPAVDVNLQPYPVNPKPCNQPSIQKAQT